MNITTIDDIFAGLPSARRFLGFKPSLTSKILGWHSLWKADGTPATGATPAAASAGGAVPTSATAGAWPHTNAAASKDAALARFASMCANAGVVRLYDRLWACSGFSGTSTSSQAVTAPGALTRPDANGADTELWGEVYTAVGSNTNYTITATYTNQAGTGSRSAVFDASKYGSIALVGQMFPFTLQAGDTGVRSVQSVILSSTSGTAGDWGLTILRGLTPIACDTAATPRDLDITRTYAAQIYDGACLALMILTSTTTSGILDVWTCVIDLPE